MTDQERLEYVRYRIDTSGTPPLTDCITLLFMPLMRYWSTAENARSHSGVKSQFTLHFVKSGKLDKKYGKLLAQLYDWRQKGDYESIEDFDAESVLPLFDPVLEMIETVEKEIFA